MLDGVKQSQYGIPEYFPMTSIFYSMPMKERDFSVKDIKGKLNLPNLKKSPTTKQYNLCSVDKLPK